MCSVHVTTQEIKNCGVRNAQSKNTKRSYLFDKRDLFDGSMNILLSGTTHPLLCEAKLNISGFTQPST